MSTIHGWPRWMRPEVAEAYAGGRTNLERLVTDCGLKPVIRHKSNTTYDRILVDAAMDRFALTLAGGGPPDKKPRK